MLRSLGPSEKCGCEASIFGMPAGALCSLNGLATQWDEIPSIRDRLRNGLPLIKEVSSKQVDLMTPATYSDLLLPVIKRMRSSNHKLPTVDALRGEIAALLEFNKRECADEAIDRYTWLVRKSLSFIKMKCRRNEPSTVTLLASMMGVVLYIQMLH